MQQPAVMHAHGARRGLRARLASLGSLRLTLWLIGALGLGVVAIEAAPTLPGWTLALPLGALALNLGGAIAVHPAFRTQSALLVFHLALLAVVLLAAWGRLSYLKGTAELSNGIEFAGELASEERGPLHARSLQALRFASLGFSVDYEAGLQRARTRNRLRFADASGRVHEATIGDDLPLRLGGYRFYTTSNKGFAPELEWVDADGAEPARGTVHLPSFPAQLARQEAEWSPPGAASPMTLRLEFGERIVDLEGAWTLRAPKAHVLRVSTLAGEAVLRSGEAHRFAEGTLYYAGLRMWMGYTVVYDPTLPWILAASALAALALAWHFAARFARSPWNASGQGRTP